MSDSDLLGIVQAALGTFEHRQSFSPGMFEPLEPLFRSLGYDGVAVYITDDYPDRMRRVSGYAGEGRFPDNVYLNGNRSLFDALLKTVADIPSVMTARLFSHERELGALAVTTSKAGKRRTRDAFQVLARSMSTMAYVERIRTNSRRERQERDLFFAQSLTNRLLIREMPEVRGLRLGSEFVRSLEAGGDFFDLFPARNGLLGYLGSCNGKGLRTVLGVTDVMRETHRALHGTDSLGNVLHYINDLLVRRKRRAHQASLCLFEVDLGKRTLHVAKSGRLGLFLCDAGGGIRNVSGAGGLFLGMMPDPEIQDETFDFGPGKSFLCFTEGFYSYRNALNAAHPEHWFTRGLEATLRKRPARPLVNAVFANLNESLNLATVNRSVESMIALSVEATGEEMD